VWRTIWQVWSVRQRADVLKLQSVPGLLFPDVYLLGRQGVYLVRSKKLEQSNYLTILLNIVSTVITMILILEIMMIKMKTASR